VKRAVVNISRHWPTNAIYHSTRRSTVQNWLKYDVSEKPYLSPVCFRTVQSLDVPIITLYPYVHRGYHIDGLCYGYYGLCLHKGALEQDARPKAHGGHVCGNIIHGRIWDGSEGGAKRYYGPLPGGPWGPCRGPVHGLGALYGASRGGPWPPKPPPRSAYDIIALATDLKILL